MAERVKRKMVKKIPLSSVFICTLVLYSFASLVYRLVPMNINTIIGVVIVFLLFILFVKTAKIRDCLLLTLFLFIVFVSLLLSTSISTVLTDAIYLITTVLGLSVFSKNINSHSFYLSVKRCRWLIVIFLVIDNAIILYSLLTHSGYSIIYGVESYSGYAYAPHSFCSAVFLIYSLFLCLKANERFELIDLLLLLPGSMGILQSGARSFIAMLIVIFFFALKKYIHKKQLRILIIPALLLAFAIYTLNSTFFEKIQMAFTGSNNNNALSVFTSGRSVFWMVDFQAFLKGDVPSILFGHGFSYVYSVNYSSFGQHIWSHNDFIDLLLSVGMFGAFIYLSYIIVLAVNVNSLVKNKFFVFLLLFGFIFELFFNGFFTYINFVFAFLILTTAFSSDVKIGGKLLSV